MKTLFRPHLAAAAAWENPGQNAAPRPYLGTSGGHDPTAAATMVSDDAFSITNYRDRLCALLGAEAERADKLKRDLPSVVRLWAVAERLAGGLGGCSWNSHRQGARSPGQRRVSNLAGDRQRGATGGPCEAHSSGTASPQGAGSEWSRWTAYIGDWIGRDQASRNLSRLWADTSVRERNRPGGPAMKLEHGIAKTMVRSATTAAPPARLDWFGRVGARANAGPRNST